MRFKYSLFLYTILLFIQNILCQGIQIDKATDSIDIAMVLWRGETEAEQGFMNGFRDQPVRFTIYDCDQKNETLLKIRSALLKSPPTLIYAFGTTVALTLTGKYNDIQKGLHIIKTPVVFSAVADPQGAGIIPMNTNLSGRNITGVSHLVPMNVQLKAMQSVVAIKSIGILYNPNEPNSRIQINEINYLAIEQSISVIIEGIPVEKDKTVSEKVLADCLNKIIASKVDIVYLPSDSYIISQSEKIVSACHAAKIPTFSATEQPIRNSNAFMGLVSRYYTVGTFAAYKAQQILNGTPAGKVPCEKAPKYSLLINMHACNALELYPPVAMLRIAEIVAPLSEDKLNKVSFR